jgi:hypothetical protein
MSHKKSIIHVVMAGVSRKSDPEAEFPDHPVCFYLDERDADRHAETATRTANSSNQDGTARPTRYWTISIAQGEIAARGEGKQADREDRELDSLDRQTLIRFVERVESSSLRCEVRQGEMIARLLSGDLSGDDREDLTALSSSEAFANTSPRTCEALRRALDALSY